MAVAKYHAGGNSPTVTLTVLQSSQDISKNQSTITWKLEITRPSAVSSSASKSYSVVIDGETWEGSTTIGGTGTKLLASGSKVIDHGTDGKKSINFNFNLFLGLTWNNIGYIGTASASGSMALTTIPRQANITSAPNFNDENNATIGYSNLAGNSVDDIQAGIYVNSGANAIASYRAIPKTETSYIFELTELERKRLRENAQSNTLDIRYYLRTSIGGTWYTVFKDAKVTIVNANPVVNSVLYEDTNATTVALTGSKAKIVMGKSNVRLHTFNASAVKEAGLTRLIIENVASTYSSNFEKTLKGYTKNFVEIKAVDSRGNTSSTFTKFFDSYVDYFSIVQKTSEALRGDNGVGEGVTLKLNGDWFNSTFGAVVNTLTATYRYRKKGGSWLNGITSLLLTINGNSFNLEQSIRGDTVSGFNIQNQYEIEVTIADKLSTGVFKIELISGAPAIAIYENNVALGGQYDESRNNQPIQLNKPAFDKNGVEILGSNTLDTRTVNNPPQWYYDNYPKAYVREFKISNVMGFPASVQSGQFCELETRVRWANNTGGHNTQIAYCDNNIQLIRIGSITWGPWRVIVTGEVVV